MSKTDVRMNLAPTEYAKVMTALKQLNEVEKEAAIMKGLKEGGEIIAEEERSLILKNKNYDTGKLYDSVGVRVKKSSQRVYVGFKYGADYGGAVAHLIASGTKNRSTSKGYNRGKVTANHFVEEAKRNKRDEAMKEIMDSIEISINKIINRNR